MLTVLRSNQPIANFIIPIAGLLFMGLFYLFGEETAELMPSVAWFQASLPHVSGVWSHYVLLMANAFILNRMFNRHEISRSPHVLAGWSFIFTALAVPPVMPLSPVLLGGIFVIAGMNEALKVFRQNDGAAHYFDAGLLIGISVLCSSVYLGSGLALIAAILYTRAAKWRELLLPVIGLLLPSMIFGVMLWLFGQPLNHWSYGVNTDDWYAPGLPLVIFAACVLIFSLAGLAIKIRSFGSSSNRSKNSKVVLLLFSIAALMEALWMYGDSAMLAAQILFYPAGWYLPWLFTAKKFRIQALLFYILFGAGLVAWASEIGLI